MLNESICLNLKKDSVSKIVDSEKCIKKIGLSMSEISQLYTTGGVNFNDVGKNLK